MNVVRHLPWTLVLLVGSACSEFENAPQDDSEETADECPLGARGCPCATASKCDSNLTCVESVCVRSSGEISPPACEGEGCSPGPDMTGAGDSDLLAFCKNWRAFDSVPDVGLDAWPVECVADELPSHVVAQPADDFTAESESAIEVAFENGMLASVAGHACVACNVEAPAFDPEIGTGTCGHSWVCGPPMGGWNIAIKADSSEGTPPGWTISDGSHLWNLGPADVTAPVCVPNCEGVQCGGGGCPGRACGSCDEGLTCNELAGTCEAPPPPPPPPPPDTRCADCLAACSGSPFCGTNLGANCYDECYTPIYIPPGNCDPMIQICI